VKLAAIRQWVTRNRELLVIELVAVAFAVLALILFLITGMTSLFGPVHG
jgi:hypothetical protein